MNRSCLAFALVVVLFSAPTAFATNGDNLMGLGVISRSMGGVGVAAPQDAANSALTNPAAMLGGETYFSGTWFDPAVSASFMGGAATDSQMLPFMIPTIGISSPLSDKLNFAIGVCGSSGLGVDYRNIPSGMGTPYGGMFTYLSIMKIAPKVAYQVSPDLSVGASLQMVIGSLDLGYGVSHNYGYGASLGVLYKLPVPATIGFTYTTGTPVEYKRVMFDGSPTLADLELEQPMNYALGVACEPIAGLLVELDGKFFNWADAKGYKTFDWKDQWVYALGVQYKPASSPWAFRAGYNSGTSPVAVHNGWDETSMAQFGFESLRVFGFPGVVETHYSLGAGYAFSKAFSADLGYTHGQAGKIKETSEGGAIIQSDISEDSYEFGFTWKY
jgi:long-chain fatty acid transport protein